MSHIIVVGGGLAGLVVCLQATQSVKTTKVTLIDKAKLGGNSIRATSGINCLNQKTERPDNFIADIQKSSQSDYQLELIETLVNQSQDALKWLKQQGICFGHPQLLGGHTQARCLRTLDSQTRLPIHVGSTLVGQLSQKCRQNSRITILEQCRVINLISHLGRVIGVKLQFQNQLTELIGDRVVLTTGGYSYNLSNFNSDPIYQNLGTTNGSFAQGDGIKMATKIGSATIGMNHIQLHPTGLIDPNDPLKREQILAPEILRAMGGLLINQQGLRFTNELAQRNQIVQDIFNSADMELRSGQPIVYLVINQTIVDQFGTKLFQFYLKPNLFIRCPDFQALADQINNPSAVGNLIFELHSKLRPPFYVAMVSPVIHYTMGGLKINRYAQVLDRSDQPIPGLFAVGEVTGGIHGHNRLAGNSLLECLVFGRIAGSIK